MKIPILKSLESREQWLSFCAQDIPYAYTSTPLALVDFQSTYLLITDIKKNLRDGRRAKKYSMGARLSNDAAWALVESCQWSLKTLLQKLSSLDFSSNVRDNSALNVHGDLTLRHFFSKDKCIISPLLLAQLTPVQNTPKSWFLNDVKRLLSTQQYSEVKWLSKDPQLTSVKAVLIQLISYPEGWRIDMQKDKIVLSYQDTFILRFTPDISVEAELPALMQQL
ncbi:MAG: hypothetical protein HRU06_02905 [Oceanospirillaceae bacterium]|nr:hypothetical protein [Oceanospirillaceae bacterium]